jgi:hypothetical protein
MNGTNSLKEKFRNIAKDIILNFKNHYLNDDGLISIHYPPNERLIFDNFDDIAPFFIYFKETDFLLEQINKLRDKHTFNEILATDNLIYSYKIDEFLGGLFCLWKETKNEGIRRYIDYVIEKINQYFIHNNNIYGTYDIYTQKRSKHYYFWSAGLLETFLEMSEYYPNLQNVVIKIANHWLKNRFFLKNCLFPFRWSDNFLYYYSNKLVSYFNCYCSHQPPIKRGNSFSRLKIQLSNLIYTYLTSGLYVQLMKSNTTFIFMLIELYKKTKDNKYKNAVNKWIEAVLNKMVKNGVVYGFYYPNGTIKDEALTNSFIFIDILMDAYHFIERNEIYLKTAENIINTQLSFQWDNGLLPMAPNAQITHLDNLVDFSVSIRRYAEISNKSQYLEKSIGIMESVVKYHSGKYGYYDHINKLGNPVFYDSNIYPPKYNGLLLKGIINVLTIKEKMYENLELHNLFNDR